MFGGFGQTPATTNATTAPSFNLGGNASTGGAGFNFGQAAPAPSTTTGATTGAAGGFNFGAATTKAATGGFGGFNFTSSNSTTTTAPAANTNAGFNFSTPAASTTASAGGGGFSFGAQTQGTSLAGSTATQATAGGFFGASTTGPPTTGAPSTTGFSLSSAPAATSAPASSGLGGAGSIFGLKTTAAATSAKPATAGFAGFGTPSTAASTSTAASGGTLLGSLLTSTASKPASTSTAATTGISGFGGFGTTTSSAAPAPTSVAGFGATSFSASTTTASSAASTTTSTSATPGKQMTFRQLEETINKWTTELEEQERNFLDQATQVNAWDRIVMDNGDRIIELNQAVDKVKLDQQKLDHELDFVHSQQRELEDLITPLEAALESLPPVSYTQHADVEREHTYVLAESLDAQLKRMGQDLKEIIERLNATNSKPDNNDPLQQVTKILNAHVTSLMWVDRNTSNLQKRVEDISKQMNVEKREQERNFRLAYS